jgi:hypothetical protein
MPGMPLRRAKREAAAKERYKQLAEEQKMNTTEVNDKVQYSDTIRDKIAEQLSSGTPIDDVTVNGAVVNKGIASIIGVSGRTIFRWQQQHEDLASAMNKARDEFANRILDRKLALADLALRDPAMANAVRAAGEQLDDVLKIRNKGNQAANAFIAALERIADCDHTPA